MAAAAVAAAALLLLLFLRLLLLSSQFTASPGDLLLNESVERLRRLFASVEDAAADSQHYNTTSLTVYVHSLQKFVSSDLRFDFQVELELQFLSCPTLQN